MLADLIELVRSGATLTEADIEAAVIHLTAEAVSAEDKADFLILLAQRTETTEEIAGFARALRKRAIPPTLHKETRESEILDVCGTGGDRLNTFNISTTVAIVASAAGVTVAKHGNRAITSASGSADVLEALGINIQLTPEQAGDWLQKHQFAFFLATAYHPSFKHIGPARKLCAERGQRTLFNFLGPLLNPAQPTAQLLGVARPDLCESVAHVLQSLGTRRAMVVCGEVGTAHLDELSTLGDATIAEFYQDRGFALTHFSPRALPLQPATLQSLQGGDRHANAQIIHDIFGGLDKGPKRDAVLLNAGAALFVAGRSRSIAEGWELALEVIESGKAKAKLHELTRASSTP